MSKPPPSTRKSTRLCTQSKKPQSKRPVTNKLKVQTLIKVSACPSIFFKSAAHDKLWVSMKKRTLVGERTLHAKDFEGSRIEELLMETNLLRAMSKLPPFVSQIVLEFYVNLSEDMGDPSSSNFQKETMQGYMFKFSPIIINQ